MRDEFAEGDAADVVAGELREIFHQTIVEPQLAAEGAERDQCRLERLAQGTEVEQRVRRYRPSRGVVGKAVVEELEMAAGIKRGGQTARLVRRRGRRQLVRDDV